MQANIIAIAALAICFCTASRSGDASVPSVEEVIKARRELFEARRTRPEWAPNVDLKKLVAEAEAKFAKVEHRLKQNPELAKELQLNYEIFENLGPKHPTYIKALKHVKDVEAKTTVQQKKY